MSERRGNMHRTLPVLIMIWSCTSTIPAVLISANRENSTIKNETMNGISKSNDGESLNASGEVKDDIVSDGGNFINVNGGYKKNSIVSGDFCARLKERYIEDNPFERRLTIFGAQRNLSVLWGVHEPAKAAAAMLVVALRYRHGFQHIHFRPGPRGICELAGAYEFFHGHDEKYNELVVHVAVEMSGPKNCSALRDCSDMRSICSAAGPRLKIVDVGSVPMDVWLQAHLATPIDPACSLSTLTPFIEDATLSKCAFYRPLPSYLREEIRLPTNECVPASPCVPVLVPTDVPVNVPVTTVLLNRVVTVLPHLRPVNVTRAFLNRALRDNSSSFLYLDYELYAGEPWQVNILQSCADRSLSSRSALRVADTALLRQFAPRIFSTVNNFAPHPADLRDVLDRESGGLPVEEAACAWALDKRSRFESWANAVGDPLWAMVFFCRDDPDIKDLKKIANLTGRYIEDEIDEFQLFITQSVIHCGNATALSQNLQQITRDMRWERMVGGVVAGAGSPAAADFAEKMQTQLALYDVPSNKTQLNAAASAVVSGASHLAHALRRFVFRHGWRRLAVLSDHSPTAEEFSSALKDSALVIREERPVSVEGVWAALSGLRDAGARVFVINMDAADAAATLSAACKLDMAGTEYAWLVREWREAEFACDARLVSVSYSWRGGDDSALNASGARLRRRLSELWPRRAWPPHAHPLADALLLLARRLQAALKGNPWLRYDLHGDGSAQIITNLYEKSVAAEGVVQPLQLRGHERADPLVFLHMWKDTKASPTLLAVWSINASGDIIEHQNIIQNAYEGAPPHDGSSGCLTKRGDPFQPQCLDGPLAFVAVFLCTTPVMLLLARRARLRRISEHLHAERVKWIIRNPKIVNALTSYLVDRSTIVLQDREELGAGHFGRVLLAVLRLPHRPPLLVAVKAPLDDADAAGEAEFLHEASMLARLQHDHIIRLVGVCATEGPLLLMQHALFGDLLRYLRERSHLLIGDPELEFVTPHHLTRMAREAAGALVYLAERRIVHRDLRAANCLIDGDRSLKLADFGMAREICKAKTTTEDDQYVYECQRRGLFPVQWMAPESVRFGVFSTATDVWGLGVLALELATLGARPFGTWLPDRVLSHVRMGKHAPLPLDASRDTREVISMCWQPAIDRATAVEVQKYLTKHPTALEPAQVPGWVPSTDDHDSGFGDKNDEPDWRIPANLSVSTL